MILLITLLVFIIGCAKKVEYIDRIVYKDRIIELKAELVSPPKCYFVENKGFYKVTFNKCNRSYCLDRKNAIKLIINIENLKVCYNQLKEWSSTICNNNNVVCLEDKVQDKIKK